MLEDVFAWVLCGSFVCVSRECGGCVLEFMCETESWQESIYLMTPVCVHCGTHVYEYVLGVTLCVWVCGEFWVPGGTIRGSLQGDEPQVIS